MTEAATNFRKNGFNDEDSAQLAQISAMFQNVADETISAGDAADFIISQLIAFNQTSGDVASNATHIVDSINEVSNSFAVSSGDLSQGLSVVASSSSSMGNSLEETLGLMTSITEVTRSASKASRGLNTIMANLAQVLDDSSSNGVKIREIYSELGLAMEDSNGQLKSGYELLSDLAGKWDTLDGNTQKYIATTLAGTTQLNNFLALMSNFDHAVEATETALNSAGSAIKENSRYMESLEAKTTALKATFEDFANNVVDNEFVDNLLDAGNAFLQFANTDLGQFITQVTLLSGFGWGAIELVHVSKILPTVASQFTSLGAVIKGTASIISAALPIIAGITILAVAGVKIYNAWKDANPTLEEAQEKINGLSSELQTNKDRLEEINNLDWSEKTQAILDEKAALEAENAELEEQIEKYKRLKKEKIDTQGYSLTALEGENAGTYQATRSTDMGFEILEISADEIENYEKAGYAIEKISEVSEYAGDALKNKLTANVEYLTTAMKNGTIAQDEYAGVIYNETVDALKDLGQYTGEYSGLLEQLESAMDTYTAEVEEANGVMELSEAEYKELVKQIPELSGKVTELNGVFSLEKTALYDLVSATDDYAKNAITAQWNVTKKTIENSKARIKAYQLEIEGLAQQGKEDSLAYTHKKDQQASEQAKINAAIRELEALLSSISTEASTTSTNLGSTATSTKKLTEATEDATDAAEEAKQAYEDWLDSVGEKLNAVISYMSEYASKEVDKLQDQIDAIDDEIDAVNAKYDEKINALDEQNEAIEKQIQLEEKLQALAEAKNKKLYIFKDGQFQYAEDTDAISSAQADLDAYNRELLLEQQKDAIEEQRDNELEQLENSKSALEAEKEHWEEYKDGWDNLESDYEYYQNKLIAEQEYGINMENSNWETRLGYFNSFNQSYNNYQQLLIQSQQYTADAEAEIWQQRLENAQNFMSQYNAIFGLGTTGTTTSGGSTTSTAYTGAGLTAEYDYNDGVDYGEKLLQSTSWAEAQHWAQQRTNAAAYRGLDISGSGEYKSNEELLKELYLKNPNIFTSGSSAAWTETKSGDILNSSAWKDATNYSYGSNTARYWAEQFGISQDYVKDALTYNTNQLVASIGGTVDAETARANKLEQIRLLEKQIAENSEAWFSADDAEKQVLHNANEAYRKLLETLKENLDNPEAGFAGFSYALGTTSASGGLSLVGERGPEMRVLNSGDGIIPADITRNLWDWGKMNPSSVMSSMSQVFNIDNLSLPNAKDAESLVTGLKQMAYQRAYKRA